MGGRKKSKHASPASAVEVRSVIMAWSSGGAKKTRMRARMRARDGDVELTKPGVSSRLVCLLFPQVWPAV